MWIPHGDYINLVLKAFASSQSQLLFFSPSAANMIYGPVITLPSGTYSIDRVRWHAGKDNGKRWSGFCSRKAKLVACLPYQLTRTLNATRINCFIQMMC